MVSLSPSPSTFLKEGGGNKLQLRAALQKTGAAELPFRNALSLKISKGCESPPDYREQAAVTVPDPRDTVVVKASNPKLKYT